jgi:hypothetical protein
VRVALLEGTVLIGDPEELLGENAGEASRIAAPVRPQIFLRRDEVLIVRRDDLAVRIRARFTARQEVVATSDDGYRARNEEPARYEFYVVH